MSAKRLFFIALLPPPAIREEVLAFKEYAAAHFGSSRALRSPAHITLFPPFQLPMSKVGALERELQHFSADRVSFSLALDGFSNFPPRVIFVNVPPNQELSDLQEALQAHLENQLGLTYPGTYGFHPHMTVAFKDLRKSQYQPAWEYFQPITYQREFEVDAVTLLVHDGKYWQVSRIFDFKSGNGY